MPFWQIFQKTADWLDWPCPISAALHFPPLKMTRNGCISFYQSIMNQNDRQNLCLVLCRSDPDPSIVWREKDTFKLWTSLLTTFLVTFSLIVLTANQIHNGLKAIPKYYIVAVQYRAKYRKGRKKGGPFHLVRNRIIVYSLLYHSHLTWNKIDFSEMIRL